MKRAIGRRMAHKCLVLLVVALSTSRALAGKICAGYQRFDGFAARMCVLYFTVLCCLYYFFFELRDVLCI